MLGPPPPLIHEPRASRIHLPAAAAPATQLWMGGADTALGEPLEPVHLLSAWVVDCANDMPAAHRDAAGLWLYRVFADIEEAPHGYGRMETLAESIGRCLRGEPGGHGWQHPPEPPARLYVLCKQGLNRSGLMMGRILRHLGLPADEALAAITRSRPGALNNLTFAALVRAPV